MEEIYNVFNEYLVNQKNDKIDEKSIPSYIDYMERLTKEVLDKYVKEELGYDKGFLNLFLQLSYDYRVQILAIISDYLKKNRKEVEKLVNGPVKNLITGFNRFSEMGFYAKIRGKGTNKIIKEKIDEKAADLEKIIFTKRQLDNIYIARLKTQDRDAYSDSDVGFPIRVIWSLSVRENKQDDLLKSMLFALEKMSYIVLKNNRLKRLILEEDVCKILHSKIEYIVFYPKKGIVKINGKKILLTENIKAKNGAYIAQEPIMDKISIDHKESMHELIKKSEKTCKNLQHISKDILDFSKDKKMRKDEIAREFFKNKGEEYSKEFVDLLVQETCGLFCVMEFVAMDKAQNSSKNDNV